MDAEAADRERDGDGRSFFTDGIERDGRLERQFRFQGCLDGQLFVYGTPRTYGLKPLLFCLLIHVHLPFISSDGLIISKMNMMGVYKNESGTTKGSVDWDTPFLGDDLVSRRRNDCPLMETHLPLAINVHPNRAAQGDASGGVVFGPIRGQDDVVLNGLQ